MDSITSLSSVEATSILEDILYKGTLEQFRAVEDQLGYVNDLFGHTDINIDMALASTDRNPSIFLYLYERYGHLADLTVILQCGGFLYKIKKILGKKRFRKFMKAQWDSLDLSGLTLDDKSVEILDTY